MKTTLLLTSLLFSLDFPQADAAPQAAPDADAKDAKPTTPKFDLRVKQIRKGLYQINRKAFENAMAAEALPKSARFVPYLVDGKTAGFKIFAIKAGSVVEQLKFVNGDALLSINKIQLNSIDAVTKAAASMQDAKKVHIKLIRDNKPIKRVFVPMPKS